MQNEKQQLTANPHTQTHTTTSRGGESDGGDKNILPDKTKRATGVQQGYTVYTTASTRHEWPLKTHSTHREDTPRGSLRAWLTSRGELQMAA